jgi:hypothetical protein
MRDWGILLFNRQGKQRRRNIPWTGDYQYTRTEHG